MVIFLFGLPGVGKSYIGQLLRERASLYFWEGDDALSLEMHEAVNREQPFSSAMMEELTSSIIQQILDLKKQHQIVVVSQAMLIESDRIKISQHVGEVLYVYVHCSLPLMRERVKRRGDFVTESYLEKLVAAFEQYKAETEAYPSIENADKTDEQLVEEIVQLIHLTNRSHRIPSQDSLNASDNQHEDEDRLSTTLVHKC